MSAQPPKLTRTIAEFVVETRLAAMPEAVIPAAKTAILDTFGVSLAAAAQPIGRIITEYVRGLGGEPVASVIGAGYRTSAPLAALANGTLAHGLDFDDRGHVSTHTLPAALAVGEMLHAPGWRVLEAYAIGREVGIRLTQAVEARRKERGGPTFRGWYRVGVIGPVAAAAAAAKLLSLDPSRTAIAIGIVASSAGGLRRNQGTMAKALHAGNAASDGVHAALLSQHGFTADPEILEAPLGYFNAICLPGEADWEPVLNRLGRPFDLERPAEIKAWPACSPSHKPIQAVLALRREHSFDVDDVEAVEADLHTFSLFRLDPREAIATGFSLPYLLAVALLDGQVGLDQVSEQRLHDPRVRALMARVRPASQAAPENGVERVTVVLRDGRRLQAEVAKARDLDTRDEIDAKFRDCAQRVLPEARAERFYESIMQIDQLEDIRTLMEVAS